MIGLDEWITGGRLRHYVGKLACANGHRWEARMFSEYGASYFEDEDTGPFCPECKQEGEVL